MKAEYPAWVCVRCSKVLTQKEPCPECESQENLEKHWVIEHENGEFSFVDEITGGYWNDPNRRTKV